MKFVERASEILSFLFRTLKLLIQEIIEILQFWNFKTQGHWYELILNQKDPKLFLQQLYKVLNKEFFS